MKNRKQKLGMVIAMVFLCAAPSCTLVRFLAGGQGDGAGTKSSFEDNTENERYTEWCDEFPRYIIPRICAYYQLHPDRFKPAGQGEEIEIGGFADFVKNDPNLKPPYLSSEWAGKIRDPWGEPVHFVQDLNMDGYIEAGGERRNVSAMGVDGQVQFTNREHHFGILKQSPFKGPHGSPSERIVAVTFYDARNRTQ